MQVAESSSFAQLFIQDQYDFCLVTVPKSGTHLLLKLMEGLLHKGKLCPDGGMGYIFEDKSKTHIDEWFESCKRDNKIPICHTNYALDVLNYAEEHDYKIVLHVRDLRDVCVSYVFWRKRELDLILGEDADFDTRLSCIIDMEYQSPEEELVPMQQFAIFANILKSRSSDIIITRFEDFVGSLGGGDDRLQEISIKRLCKQLKISCATQNIKLICGNLFGDSPTFREGKIGSWSEYFNGFHKALFKEKMGQFLINFGYEKDLNW